MHTLIQAVLYISQKHCNVRRRPRKIIKDIKYLVLKNALHAISQRCIAIADCNLETRFFEISLALSKQWIE